ncbi:hypothetical protein [Terrimonas ferruginea]|nr:hypothetical protein [Terrimonas ferruginea]
MVNKHPAVAGMFLYTPQLFGEFYTLSIWHHAAVGLQTNGPAHS